MFYIIILSLFTFLSAESVNRLDANTVAENVFIKYNNTTNEAVTFGLFSTNEMMIIFGLAYFD